MLKVLLLFSIYIFSTLRINAAQLATVRSPKAIIYGDMALKVPLGYVKKGKKLQVGEVKRKRGRILPVAINGRVGWIKTTDIIIDDEVKEFESGPKVFEHEILTADEEAEQERFDPMTENNYLIFRMGNFSASEESLNVVRSTGSEEYSANLMSLYFEHRHPYKSYAWGVGFDYYKLESEFITYQVPVLKGQVNYIPFKFKFISLEGFAGLMISSDVKIKSAGLGTNKGTLYGLEYGVLARLFPDSKIGASAGLAIINGNPRNIEAVENINNNDSEIMSKFGGTSVFINLHYKL